MNPDSSSQPVIAHLLQRGLEVERYNPPDEVCWPKAEKDTFYRLLGEYAFRLFFRDLLLQDGPFDVATLARYPHPTAVKRFLKQIEPMKFIRSLPDDRFERTDTNITSFGRTLEWYLAEVLRREFSAPSAWGVRLKGAGPGDFDVIALLAGRLAYIEVKSGPPRQVEARHVESFHHRMETLRPDIALFFEDTHLRMKDKIVPLFEDYYRANKTPSTLDRIEREIFSLNSRLFILNSYRNITTNLRTCLKTCFQQET